MGDHLRFDVRVMRAFEIGKNIWENGEHFEEKRIFNGRILVRSEHLGEAVHMGLQGLYAEK